MKIVIEIPKEMWEQIEKGYVPLGISKYLKNGTPLPQGHGRLIDADAFNEELDSRDYDTYNDYSNTFDWIEQAPTIIEADEKEGKEK